MRVASGAFYFAKKSRNAIVLTKRKDTKGNVALKIGGYNMKHMRKWSGFLAGLLLLQAVLLAGCGVAENKDEASLNMTSGRPVWSETETETEPETEMSTEAETETETEDAEAIAASEEASREAAESSAAEESSRIAAEQAAAAASQSEAERLAAEASVASQSEAERLAAEAAAASQSEAERQAAEAAAAQQAALQQQQAAAQAAAVQPAGELVWLSATGSKYHTIPNCGNMNPNKARQVTLSEAQAMGMEPCKKCH